MKMYKNPFVESLCGSFLLWLILCGCNKNTTFNSQSGTGNLSPVDTVVVSPVEDHSTVYLALGDSYTIGQSVDSAQRFPAQTAALLNHNGISISGVEYIAATGWTTTNLQNAIDIKNPQGSFAAITLLIGVNDQYQQHDTSGYRERFINLLTKAILLAGSNKSHVFVLSVPDYGVTPFGDNYPDVSIQIDEFNAINKSVTDAYGITYINVTNIGRNDAGDNTMLAPDKLHPSGLQYAQWTALLVPAMAKNLK